MRHNSVKPIGFSSESIEIHRAEKQTHVQRYVQSTEKHGSDKIKVFFAP